MVGYDEERKNPAWSAYRCPGEVRFTEGTRPRRFETDTRTRAQVRPDDYAGTGYDRGHMTPNYAIFSRFGEEAQRETFLMSNICPQYPNLNRGRWKQLEALIAGHSPGQACWAKACGEVWVIVGPIYRDPPARLPAGVAIPSHFYALVIDEEEAGGDVQVLAFIMPNQAAVGGQLAEYLTSVDEVELHTGLDFLSDLDDAVEDLLEMQPATRLWPTQPSSN